MRWLTSIGLFIFLGSFAQETIRVKSYDIDQGLPMNTVWDLAQDKFGFLWVSTADGLSRFDGYTFHNHRISNLDSSAIHGQAWHSLAFDSSGNMWIAHENGIDTYNVQTGAFYAIYRLPNPETLALNKIIDQDDEANFYIWIIGQGLLKFNSNTRQKLAAYIPSEEYRNNMVRDGIRVGREKLWLVQQSNKIIEFDIKRQLFSEIRLPDKLQALSLNSPNDSTVLVGTTQGILRFHTQKDQFSAIEFKTIVDVNFLAPIATTSILKVSRNEFWIGTNKGLFIYNDSTRSFSNHFASLTPNEEILVIQKLYQDRSGNIWIATNGNGLKRYAPHSPQWKFYRANHEQNDIVKSIYADTEKIYIGYFQKGIDVFDRSGQLLKIFNLKSGLPNENVYAIKPLKKNELFLSFLGSPANSFGILNTETNQFKSLYTEIKHALRKPMPATNHFPSAIIRKNGELVFTYQYHLLKLETSGKVSLIKTFDEILNVVYEDSNEQLWLGTMQSLHHQAKDGSWRVTTVKKQIKTMEEAADGNLWLGTVGGLFIIDKSGQVQSEFHTGEKLVNDFIYGILRDTNNNMWFSHNRGLTRYNWQSQTFKHFSVDDGLQANEFNTGAYYKSDTGELFFGGVKGTNSFFPQNISENPKRPDVRITKIEINDTPYHASLAPWAIQEVVMQYPQNTLALEFAALEFTEPIKNKYRWRLVNIDNNWVEAGNKRQTRYANLQPGGYVFEIKASNNDGVWNEYATTIKITVLPPWWLTWWFKIIFILIGISVVGLTAYLISRQRYKRRINELLVQQKIQKDRDRISRDLHDNVGSMVSFVNSKVDWLLKNNTISAEAADGLLQIKANAATIMTGLRETIWAIREKPITNTDLADKLKVYLKAQLLIPSQVFDEIKNESILTHEAALNIYRSCQEVINNINKHSQATLVNVIFTDLQGTLEIRIQDNGIGISTNELNKIGHYGLANIKERLSIVGASLKIDSSSTSGTTITIRLDSAKTLLI